MRQPFELLAALARSAPRRSYEAAAAWLVLSRAFWDERPDLIRQVIDAAAGSPARPSTAALLGHLDAAMRHDVADRLPQIRVPTLVIAGDQDRLVPPDYSERVAAAIPGSRFELLRGAGHGFAVERADDFLAITTAFLEEVGAAWATR